MKIGLFCYYPDEGDDSFRAIRAQTTLVQHAEAVGFDEAWIAEHHFDPHAVSPSILVLMGHLAGVTTRLRIGSAAVLLPFRNPIQVAEDIATIDILSDGRFNFGVARGGPFPGQNEHFGIDRSCSRRAMLESLTLIKRLLYEQHVHFSGEFYNAENVTITPRPVQVPVPTWIASMSDEGVRYAARHGMGVMATLLAAPEKLGTMVKTYREAAPQGDPRLAVARFFHTAATRDQARNEAWPHVVAFADRMRANTAAAAPNEPNNFSGDVLMARSLIGSHDDVRAQICALREHAAISSLMLKPAVPDNTRARCTLDAFMRHVRPHLPTVKVAELLP